MADFSYKASDASGTLTTGTIAANSRSDAYRLLRNQGLQPMSVSEGEGASTAKKESTASGSEGLPRLNTTQLLYFTEELAELLEAGLKLEGALKVIEQRQEKSGVQPIAARLRQRVRDGFSFSAALQECGKTFDPLYCNLVAAGEVSGALPQILKRQCAYLTLISDLRRRVVSSLLYPAIVFTS
jgi:general secretion pathway protein F/type IV pilus assembly protein PilC